MVSGTQVAYTFSMNVSQMYHAICLVIPINSWRLKSWYCFEFLDEVDNGFHPHRISILTATCSSLFDRFSHFLMLHINQELQEKAKLS